MMMTSSDSVGWRCGTEQMYCDSVLDAYRTRFHERYEFAVEHGRRAAGIVAAEVVVLLAALTVLAIVKGLVVVITLLSDSSDTSNASANESTPANHHGGSAEALFQWSCGVTIWDAAVLGLLWAILRLLLRKAALVSFFNGSVKGFMVTMYRKDKLIPTHSPATVVFAEQRGDIENPFRPRAYQVVRLLHTATQQALSVVHLHTNALGSTALRKAQVAETARLAKSLPGIIVLLGDFNDAPHSEAVRCCSVEHDFVDTALEYGHGNMDTWVRANPMTVGYMRVPDFRCDYIFLFNHSEALRNAKTNVVLNNRSVLTSDHYGMLLQCEVAPPGRA